MEYPLGIPGDGLSGATRGIPQLKNTSKRGVNVLRAAALVLGGAAAWIILSSSQAGAIALVDQESETTNVGVAVANTGGNDAVGNESDNDADVDQDATAFGGGDDTVAVNLASGGNSSTGSAHIATGDATAVGNQSATSNTQAVHSGGNNGGLTLVDQESSTTNGGLAIANTGINTAIGNASDNDADIDQDATAFGGDDDTVAVNIADGFNHSSGSASIVTGDANAIGNHSTTHNVQVLDADHGSSLDCHGSHLGWATMWHGTWSHCHNFGHNFGGFTLADQSSTSHNFGFALANSGINGAIGNESDNDADLDQDAVAFGGDEDNVAVNISAGGNSTTGATHIATGSASALGNSAHNSNTQVLDTDGVAATRAGNSMLPLAVLLGLLFVATPVRRLAIRR